MTNPQLLDELVGMVIAAADDAAMNRTHRTQAEQVKAAVREAFACAAANGLISLTARADWPEYIAFTPPYKLPAFLTEQGKP